MRALGLILITVVACQRSEPAPTSDPSIDLEKQLDEAGRKIKEGDVLGARENYARMAEMLEASDGPKELRVKVCSARADFEQMTDFLYPEGALSWLDDCEKLAVEGFYPDHRLAILSTRAQARLRAGVSNWTEDRDAAVDLATRLHTGADKQRMSDLRALVYYLADHGQREPARQLAAQLDAIAK